VIDAARPRVAGFVPTGKGAHGLYASRDSRHLYVSNRAEGSISLVSFVTRKVAATWRLPGPHGLCVYPRPGRYSLGHTGVFR
jgi:DNA-binding beta-propeller fold protein YncE